MWTLPGEETRPAGGTRWSGTIRLPEENAFVRSDHYAFVKKGVPASQLRVGMEMQLAVDTLYADTEHEYLVYVWEPAT